MPSKPALNGQLAKFITFPVVCLTFVLANPHLGQKFLLFQFRRLLIKQPMTYLMTKLIARKGQISKCAMDQRENILSPFFALWELLSLCCPLSASLVILDLFSTMHRLLKLEKNPE